MARDHREVVEGGLKIKAMGNELLRAIGGRAIHPVNVRVGGFYKAPSRADLEALVPRPGGGARAGARVGGLGGGLDFPDFEQDYEFVALRHPDRYAIEDGRLVSELRPRHRPRRVRRALRRGAGPALDGAPVAA